MHHFVVLFLCLGTRFHVAEKNFERRTKLGERYFICLLQVCKVCVLLQYIGVGVSQVLISCHKRYSH